VHQPKGEIQTLDNDIGEHSPSTEACACFFDVTRNGDGVKASHEKADEWLLKAAEAGFPSAMFNLHLAIESGEYAPSEKGKENAVKRRKGDAGLRKRDAVSEGEDADVQEGENADLALHWLEKAAAAHHPKALYNLAMRLRDG
jgi:TPR repeat protein